MGETQIRRARQEDLEAVLDLWLEMMRYHGRLDPRFAPADNARDAFHNTMREWIGAAAKRVLVAVADGQVVGYAIGSIAENPPILKLRHFGHVSDICVPPEWRRQGIGRRLFGALRKWFRSRGLAVVQLNVAALNPAAQAFWREMGFQDHMDRMWQEI